MAKLPTKTKRGIPVKGVTLKDGKLVKAPRRTDVSTKIRQRSSKKVSVKRRTA